MQWPLFVLVEKILSESEPLPYSWTVHGTTGYDFMYVVNNLFVNQAAEAAFDALYSRFIAEPTDLASLSDASKKLVLTQSLTSELEARSAELARIVEQTRRYRGFTRNSLAFGLSEFVAALEIYRTYITGPGQVSDRDRAYVDAAIHEAQARNPLVPSGLFEFLRETLLMENFESFPGEQQAALRRFVMKFQQITGPVMAKSMEDTAFYIYNRLVSLNEVGGHLNRFGASVEEFHAHNTNLAYPHAMLSSSTHDTKRSEDVRARINALSELPEDWARMVERWAVINADAKTEVNGQLAPSRNDEYLIYQTLLGAYQPGMDEDAAFLERIITYMHKAINEAKRHSNWINPNAAYAQAVADFVTHIWGSLAFRETFDAFLGRVQFFGWMNALGQTLLKLTCPGVPDIYQGNELWNFSLVDPDNRRPVDFAQRHALLDDLHDREQADRAALLRDLLATPETGAIKLYLTARTLAFRRQHEALFSQGDYAPVAVEGPQAEHLCAFVRRHAEARLLVIVPRLTAILMQGEPAAALGEAWGDTRLLLPEGLAGQPLENVLTGERVVAGQHLPLAAALAIWPLAVF
ncbi:MAG: malto-oligosyltrehalose synthase, partial [Anaerolineae bacterium]|nr:malto-oligosyltrehalose synthase [Anaerolineae bacterium]